MTKKYFEFMDTVVENKTYSFKSGDKCMFCQTPMLQPNVVKIPKYLGDTNKGSCCTKCSDHITNAFSQLRDFQLEKFLIINELVAKFSNPQYNNN